MIKLYFIIKLTRIFIIFKSEDINKSKIFFLASPHAYLYMLLCTQWTCIWWLCGEDQNAEPDKWRLQNGAPLSYAGDPFMAAETQRVPASGAEVRRPASRSQQHSSSHDSKYVWFHFSAVVILVWLVWRHGLDFLLSLICFGFLGLVCGSVMETPSVWLFERDGRIVGSSFQGFFSLCSW